MVSKILKIMGLSAAMSLAAASGSAAIVDGFENGLDPAWQAVSEGGNIISSGTDAEHAINGNQGLNGAANTWMFINDQRTELNVGDRLSVLIRTESTINSGGNRVYLGFDADQNGASSFIASSFNGQGSISFQNNDNFGFDDLNSQAFSFAIGHTYKMTVDFLESGVIGSLFDNDSGDLLGSLQAIGLNTTSLDGLALRTFGAFAIDDLSIAPGFNVSAVPVPPSLAFGLTGLLGLALLGRRKMNKS